MASKLKSSFNKNVANVMRKIIKIPKVKLNSGQFVPQLSIGTYALSKPTKFIEQAVKLGYDHFDCAYVYLNEQSVGQVFSKVFRSGMARREDIYITGKLWNTFHKPSLVPQAVKQSLAALKIDYFDLYLMHSPMGFKEGEQVFPVDHSTGTFIPSDVDYLETWKAMEEVYTKGTARSIGVCNFNSNQIERLIETARIQPAVLQIECHPYLNQEELIKFCQDKGIRITAYGTLGAPAKVDQRPDQPVLLQDDRLEKLTKKYNKSRAQILIRYQMDRGNICLIQTSDSKTIDAILDILKFELLDEDIKYLNSFQDTHKVRYMQMIGAMNHKFYPFSTKIQ